MRCMGIQTTPIHLIEKILYWNYPVLMYRLDASLWSITYSGPCHDVQVEQFCYPMSNPTLQFQSQGKQL